MASIRYSLAVAGVAAALLAPDVTQAQGNYPQTLYWGAGLIDIPVAWVSPLTGDFAINYSGKTFEKNPTPVKIDYNDQLNSQLVMSMSFMGRLEVGYAAFSSNPEWGLFGRGVLIRQEDFSARGGWAGLLVPSLALGVRNVGPYGKIDRFGIGYQLFPPCADQNDPTGQTQLQGCTSPDAQHVIDRIHRNFETNNTFYGVATKDLSLAEIRPNWPDVNFGLSVGYGNGLFNDDGGLGDLYASHDRGGLFWGLKSDFNAGPNMTLSLMFEDNSWDYNMGASLNYRGIRAGLYMTEIGAGSKPEQQTPGGTTADDTTKFLSSYIYNYSKIAFTLGWQSNIFALLRGDFLQSRAAELERQRQGLLAEINRRQQRIAELELEINRYEAQNLLDLEQRRVQAEQQLREEREILKRLEDRLKRIEQQQPTPPANPPANPPVR